MIRKIILFLFFTLHLYSFTLQSIYYVNSKNIKLRDIIADAKYDVTLYKIDYNRYSKKIKSKNIKLILEKHGYTDIETSSRYIKFIKKSPIDLSLIETALKKSYKRVHPSIKINSILIMPRGYIKSLPKKYDVSISKKAYISNKGTLSIKTLTNKKIFFDYLIDAKINVYFTKYTMQRGEQLSTLNTLKQTMQFEKFRALPITIKDLNMVQAKRSIKAGIVITKRDIVTIDLVKKGSTVNVNLNENNINISFLAKALQSGKLHDIITVQKSNLERLRVKVIGKNMVEIK